MPVLFYGSLPTTPPLRAVYSVGLSPVKTSIFDSYKVEGLAPASKLSSIAHFWHFPMRKHSVIAWHEEGLKHEQMVWLPGLLSWQDALELSRAEFPSIIPSSIVFRQKLDGILRYD